MITGQLLTDLELRYAPTVGSAPAVFSAAETIRTDTHNAGGDKMAADRNGYADLYAQVLDGLDPRLVVELGVFQGVSLAIWCDLFPDAHVVGLDLDFSRYHHHKQFLTDRGAFSLSRPSLVKFDAYSPRRPSLRNIDLFVDDGPHTEPAIRNVLSLFAPFMPPGSVYVVEDFAGGDRLLAEVFPRARLVSAGRWNAALM
jgi:cephalosporin hydroxylase